MVLIDRDAYRRKLENAICRNLRIGRPNPVVLMALQYAIATLDSEPVVEAIPIEFIEEFIQGIIQTRDKQIQDTSKWRHFDDNIVVLVALLDSWKEEQEKNNGNQ